MFIMMNQEAECAYWLLIIYVRQTKPTFKKFVSIFCIFHFLTLFPQETIIKDVLSPTIKLVSSSSSHFPGGSTIRTVICHKLVDVIYVIGLRLGFEMTRNQMTVVLKEFFSSFNQVYGEQMLRSESSQSLTDYKQGTGLQGVKLKQRNQKNTQTLMF